MKSYIGIDWSEAQHDIRIHNEAGARLARLAIEHSMEGFQKLEEQLHKFNPEPANCLVAIETHDNQLVHFLCERGYPLYVIAPGTVNGNRSRHRASGAKDDDKDAYLLADIVRTDHGRLLPWQSDGVLLRQLRLWLNWVDEVTNSAVRIHNRLRANLLRYYRQALAAFPNLQTNLALRFLQRWPSPAHLQALTATEFYTFAKAERYSRRDLLPGIFAQLQASAPVADEATVTAAAAHTVQMARQLLLFVQQKRDAIRTIGQLFAQHEDAPIFDSLPGAGPLLAPKLLVMFGDHREHYPDPTILPAVAGTCPITRKSGKSRAVSFRRACNRRYRHTAQQFAICSVRKSVWAAGYFQRAKARNLSDSHAYRCLANRWLYIIWTLWQKREPYDEAYHLKQIQRRRQPL